MILAFQAIWAGGSLLIVLHRYRDWRRLRFSLRTSMPFEVATTIEVRVSPQLLDPSVIGWRRPVLLLPAGIAGRLTPSQLDAVLTHEMAHARRNDNLLALVHMLVELLFWFCPVVWWIGARELQTFTDDHCARGDRRQYATANRADQAKLLVPRDGLVPNNSLGLP